MSVVLLENYCGKKNIVKDADFTESYKDIRISVFCGCCPVAKKVFR